MTTVLTSVTPSESDPFIELEFDRFATLGRLVFGHDNLKLIGFHLWICQGHSLLSRWFLIEQKHMLLA
jgi:hypothetical protein